MKLPMKPLRRTIAALSLLWAICSPLGAVLAQAPPAVGALPDSERRTSYSLNASTCACAINMQLYASGSDVDAWLQVWVNGVRYLSTDPTFGWSLSSITGSLTTIPRPITNAVLTFNAPVTGTVQIVGAERPRQLAQFSENTGVPARALNQRMTEITAVERELWDKTNDVTGRAILTQPGNIMGPLPQPPGCVNSVLGFDVTGINPVCLPGVSVGTIIAPLSSLTVSSVDPTIGAPSDSHAVGISVTTDSSNISPGFGAQVEGTEHTFTYLHGDHSDASKTTASAELFNFNGGGPGQKFGIIIKQTCPGSGDCQAVSINSTPYGGIQASGDEGAVLYAGGVFYPSTNVIFTATGNGTVGGGNTTTTQSITGATAAQTVTVSSSAGFTVGEWIIVNGSPSSPQNGEAVQLTGVAAGTITGIFRLSQSNGAAVRPATVLPVSGTGGVGEHRYLIDDSLPTYTTGTITFDDPTSRWIGSGTTWTAAMVGGNSTDVGCISADVQGTGNKRSWFHISAINSTTNITAIPGVANDITSASNYKIAPCAFVYRVIPTTTYGGAGTLILENNAFTWSSGDNIEQAVGPTFPGVLGRWIDNQAGAGPWPNASLGGLEIDELGGIALNPFINMVNFGNARITAGANQTTFIKADTSSAPGQINNVIQSLKTIGLLSASINNGGTYAADAYGFGQFGLVENVNMAAAGNRVVGAGFELNPTWNNNSYHALIGGNVTDTLSTAGSDLINLQVGGVTKFRVKKDGTITAGLLTVGTSTITSGTSGRVLYDNAGVLGELTVTGSGSAVLTTSPTLVTPVLGVAGGTSLALNGATLGNNILAEAGSSQFNGANETTTITDGNGNTDNGTLIVQRLVTNLNAVPNGIVIDVQDNNTSASHTSRGLDVAVTVPSGNSTAHSNMNAYLAVVSYAGTGGAGAVLGNSILSGNTGTGTITEGAGEFVQVQNSGGGTSTLSDGLQVVTPIGATATLTSVWTNINGIEIQDQKPTGAGTNTLTNPPVALLIDSQTASGAFAIKQNGSGLNLFNGTVSSVGGFIANGLVGLSTVCTETVGNTLTFTLGILTTKGANCT